MISNWTKLLIIIFIITYFLSKLLPLIFSPLGIILILLSFFIIKKKQKYIYAAIIFLLTFSNYFFSKTLWILLEYPWQRIDYSLVDFADGIVVLSGGRHLPPGDSKIIEWSDPDRYFAGIELFRAKKSNKLIFTGGANPFNSNLPPEGDIYIAEALAMGIPKKNLYTTEPVFNTFQEAKAISKLLNKVETKSQNKIILVTSAFHMKRAKKLFEREGIIVQPYPVDFRTSKSFFNSLKNPISFLPSANNFKSSSDAIREIIGRTIYRIF